MWKKGIARFGDCQTSGRDMLYALLLLFSMVCVSGPAHPAARHPTSLVKHAATTAFAACSAQQDRQDGEQLQGGSGQLN